MRRSCRESVRRMTFVLSPQVRADVNARVDDLRTFVDGVAILQSCVHRMRDAVADLQDTASCASQHLADPVIAMIRKSNHDALSLAGELAASDAIALQDDDRERVRAVVLYAFDTLVAAANASEQCGFWDKAMEFVKDLGVVVRTVGTTA